MLPLRLRHCLGSQSAIEEYGSIQLVLLMEIRQRKRNEGKIRRLLREQHELKIPQESVWCFLRKLKPCPSESVVSCSSDTKHASNNRIKESLSKEQKNGIKLDW